MKLKGANNNRFYTGRIDLNCVQQSENKRNRSVAICDCTNSRHPNFEANDRRMEVHDLTLPGVIDGLIDWICMLP